MNVRLTLLACALASGLTQAQLVSYSANVGESAPKRLLWGDSHLHSSWSGDAGALRDRLDPEMAVRFAR